MSSNSMLNFLFALILLASVLICWAVGLILTKKKKLWIFSYFISFLFIIIIALGHRFHELEFVYGLRWLLFGRQEFIIAAAAASLIFAILYRKLEKKYLKIFIVIFTVLVSVYCLIPFIGPIIIRGNQVSLATVFDNYGVCLQENNFNCGPAAAVTALHHCGIEAYMHEIAIAANTTPITGTPPDLLILALRKKYGDKIDFEFRKFQNPDEMNVGDAILVLIQYSPYAYHYVYVFKVIPKYVLVGDPMTGRFEFKRDNFEKIWRKYGIVFRIKK